MRITFERTGGFMGRKVSLNIDLNDLPPDQSATLRRLLDEANFLAIEETATAASPVRDGFQYLISVETKNVQHTVHMAEATIPTSVRPLVDELLKLARDQRTG
jgi:emfourin